MNMHWFRWAKTWGGRSAVVAIAIVTLALGFCLFGGAHAGMDGHVPSPELCLAMLAASFAPVFLFRLFMSGQLQLDPVRSLHPMPLHRLDPPPKSRSLS